MKREKKQTKVIRKYHKLVREDSDLAWTIHSNLAMMMYDTGIDHLVANERSAELLNRWFGVDVTESSYWAKSKFVTNEDSKACSIGSQDISSEIYCYVQPQHSETTQTSTGLLDIAGKNKSYSINELLQIIVL